MALTVRYSLGMAEGVKSCGGSKDTTPQGIMTTTTPLNSLFDKVLKQENILGTIEYRCIYLCNDDPNNVTAYSPKVRIISSPESIISLGGVAKNVIAQEIATEKTMPSGIVFKTQADLNNESGGYLTFPNTTELAPGEFAALWIQRKVNSSSGSGTITEELVLEFKYDT